LEEFSLTLTKNSGNLMTHQGKANGNLKKIFVKWNQITGIDNIKRLF